MSTFFEHLGQTDPILLGMMASVIAGLATTGGAIPVFLPTQFSGRTMSGMIGFGAGVMLSATFFSLLAPALNKQTQSLPDAPLAAISIVSLGVLAGAVLVFLADHFLPMNIFLKDVKG